MKLAEIKARLTGVYFSSFGLSWNPSEAEATAARRVIAFLEDRRVLYQPTEMEQPRFCIESIRDIRRLDEASELAQNLRAMRAACRKFLDQMQSLRERDSDLLPVEIAHGGYSSWVFCGALGELRGAAGLHIGLIAVRNGLDVEGDLATILPGIDAETRDDAYRFFPW